MEEEASREETTGKARQTASQKLVSTSQYDFVPGDKILYFEDFSQDAIGDFPALWTTDGSGEVKTVNIDVIQEAILDELQIGQGGFGNRIELVDIEYDQITETDTLLLVHPDQFLIHLDGRRSTRYAKDKLLTLFLMF
jgi:hypothetical protein